MQVGFTDLARHEKESNLATKQVEKSVMENASLLGNAR